MIGEAAPDRTLWALTGADALTFLQGLVSNDLRPLSTGPGIVWAALLTPQGKYLADFFVVHRPEGGLLIDIATLVASATLRRLTLYRLRADVQLTPLDLHVHRGFGPAPTDALPDPRHPALGWRAWRAAPGSAPVTDWALIRVEHLIPEIGIELLPDDSYILEHGFERLHGVDFRKGCYVGQEVTARMKHKTDLRKGLVRLGIEGTAPIGTEITSAGKPAGVLFTQAGGRALAHLRLDRTADLKAGSARLWPETAADGAASAEVTNP
jgi:hypothetical protein